MKPWWMKLCGCTLAALVLFAEPAAAAWNNVFQVTCCNHFRRSQVNYAPAPVAVQSSPVVAVPSVAADPCAPAICSSSPVRSEVARTVRRSLISKNRFSLPLTISERF